MNHNNTYYMSLYKQAKYDRNELCKQARYFDQNLGEYRWKCVTCRNIFKKSNYFKQHLSTIKHVYNLEKNKTNEIEKKNASIIFYIMKKIRKIELLCEQTKIPNIITKEKAVTFLDDLGSMIYDELLNVPSEIQGL